MQMGSLTQLRSMCASSWNLVATTAGWLHDCGWLGRLELL